MPADQLRQDRPTVRTGRSGEYRERHRQGTRRKGRQPSAHHGQLREGPPSTQTAPAAISGITVKPAGETLARRDEIAGPLWTAAGDTVRTAEVICTSTAVFTWVAGSSTRARVRSDMSGRAGTVPAGRSQRRPAST